MDNHETEHVCKECGRAADDECDACVNSTKYCCLCGKTDIYDWYKHFREHNLILNSPPQNPDGTWKELSENQ